MMWQGVVQAACSLPVGTTAATVPHEPSFFFDYAEFQKQPLFNPLNLKMSCNPFSIGWTISFLFIQQE